MSITGVAPVGGKLHAGEATGPVIEWAPYSTNPPVDIPAVSGAQSSFGIMVRVWDDRSAVEAFRVTVNYLLNGDLCSASKLIERTRDGVNASDGWSTVGFDLGQPVVVYSIHARSLDSCGSSELVTH